MLKYLALILTVALAGCDLFTGSAGSPDGLPEPDGTATATIDGREYTFRVYAQPSAYDAADVVLRAYSDELLRTVMLTFEPSGETANVNVEMTGYWDLGLCTPSDAYVVAEADDVDIQVREAESGRLRGTFALRAEKEGAPGDTVSITDGSFDVRLAAEPFEYCVEG